MFLWVLIIFHIYRYTRFHYWWRIGIRTITTIFLELKNNPFVASENHVAYTNFKPQNKAFEFQWQIPNTYAHISLIVHIPSFLDNYLPRVFE